MKLVNIEFNPFTIPLFNIVLQIPFKINATFPSDSVNMYIFYQLQIHIRIITLVDEIKLPTNLWSHIFFPFKVQICSFGMNLVSTLSF